MASVHGQLLSSHQSLMASRLRSLLKSAIIAAVSFLSGWGSIWRMTTPGGTQYVIAVKTVPGGGPTLELLVTFGSSPFASPYVRPRRFFSSNFVVEAACADWASCTRARILVAGMSSSNGGFCGTAAGEAASSL